MDQYKIKEKFDHFRESTIPLVVAENKIHMCGHQSTTLSTNCSTLLTEMLSQVTCVSENADPDA
jgi:hypothetical protein